MADGMGVVGHPVTWTKFQAPCCSLATGPGAIDF